MRITMKPGVNRGPSDTDEIRLYDLIKIANDHFWVNVEKPFWTIKCQLGFRKVSCRGICKNDLKARVLIDQANHGIVEDDIQTVHERKD